MDSSKNVTIKIYSHEKEVERLYYKNNRGFDTSLIIKNLYILTSPNNKEVYFIAFIINTKIT